MPRISYIDKRFNALSLVLIRQANDILEEFYEKDLSLTLRQLYYQFIARDLFPESWRDKNTGSKNNPRSYKRFGYLISNARLSGLIDWYSIEDRTRNLRRNSHWSNPGAVIRSAARSFMLDHWKGQDYRVEVWIEKDALIGVISDICQKLDVNYFACKGYVSQSEMWNASQRFLKYERNDQTPVIIHLGDHDPSGIDMSRDIDDRQYTFEVSKFILRRIALNMDQVEKYNPPPNPAKFTDSRCTEYVAKYGSDSWELDALDPETLRDLIEETVLEYRDEDIYLNVINQENAYREILDKVEKNWETL